MPNVIVPSHSLAKGLIVSFAVGFIFGIMFMVKVFG